MTSHEELIAQFADVTGAEAERAQFYLESSAWHLDVALASFFETDEQVASTSVPAEHRILDSGAIESASSEPQVKEITSADSSAISKPRITTLRDVQKRDSSSDEEEGQAFYAGGSATSGQQVLGPGKKKDLITEMFKSCQEQSLSLENRSSSEQSNSTFSGIGYKLGQTNSHAEVVAAPSSGQHSGSGLIVLKMWRNGFTINERELRPYNDPKNREFLAAVKRGEVPMEIKQEIQGGEVRLDMEDHRNEEYLPPKGRVNAFSGKGYILGSPSPATVGMTVTTDPSDEAANERQARSDLNFNTNEPATTIQIRLADGSNIRGQFNLFHTIGDLRRFIITLRPQYATTNFIILTAYPTKELEEENSTISEANLQNSIVIQRLK